MDYEKLARSIARLERLFVTARTAGDYRYIERRAQSLPGLRAEQIAYRAESMIDLMQSCGIGTDRAEA
jgi:hypothetical protein